MPEVTPAASSSPSSSIFLLGYLLYSSLFAAVGASVNTTQEAQSLAFPVFMPLVVGVMFFPMVLQSPGQHARPPSSRSSRSSTPLLMFLRITVLTPPVWQIVLSIVLTAADDRGRALGGGAHLPGRHPDVREAADVPGDPAVGQQKVGI